MSKPRAHDAADAAYERRPHKGGRAAAHANGKGGGGGDKDLRRRQTRISKSMSRILRHKAVELGVPISEDGYVAIRALLAHLPPRTSAKDVHEAVRYDAAMSKGRFRVSDDGERVRANQGHSMAAVRADAVLTKLTDPARAGACVHGTTRKRLDHNIKLVKDAARERTERAGDERIGLSRMGRNMVHFAKARPDDPNAAACVQSGARSSSNVFVYCDVAAAMRDGGLDFYESSNGVILTSGNRHGVVPSRYLRVELASVRGFRARMPCADAVRDAASSTHRR
jgi:2'-phosphotransferase